MPKSDILHFLNLKATFLTLKESLEGLVRFMRFYKVKQRKVPKRRFGCIFVIPQSGHIVE